ncbi:hypothetical protein BST47_04075 [Mycolicibacterium tusciae]|uniref:Uncharacterized protein n=1 Tax=Mycolicibacterium tusciae TaxID=75922 RepID=A0A1X0JYH1_9MYCO|nr:hypothetical protein BST47_04075 [Mycolicibacterium tusciae]
MVPTALPGVPSVLAVPIAPNLANSIDSLYLAVEPWVQYGFEVATYALAWVPYVGFLSGLIMDGYFFGESIVASAVFNFTDFLRGDGNLVENLVDFGIDVGLAFVWLGLDALNTFIPLPPFCCYPPRPPVQGPFLALDTLTTLMRPAQEKTMELTSIDESAQGTETGLDETAGEQIEGVVNAVTPEEGPPAKTVRELVGELVDRFTGERVKGGVKGGEEQLEEGGVPGQTNPALTAGELTDEHGTVRAQGQVRSSVVATPSTDKTETGPRGGKLNEKLAKLAQSLSPKKPSPNADGQGDPGAGDQAAGDTSGPQ